MQKKNCRKKKERHEISKLGTRRPEGTQPTFLMLERLVKKRTEKGCKKEGETTKSSKKKVYTSVK